MHRQAQEAGPNRSARVASGRDRLNPFAGSMRILLVDDDPTSLEPVEHVLRSWGHLVDTAIDGDEAWNRLQGPDFPDVVILDWMMPQMDGLELTRRIRKRSHAPYIYVIMVTGRKSHDDLLAGFRAGVDDFLSKPPELGELQLRLMAAERIVDLQNELIDAREAIRRQAAQDPLTRILNHRMILESLSREVERAHAARQPVSVILADMDHFKRVNDTHGHVAGDRVLIEVARRIRQTVRSREHVGRYGGEEFLIVLPGVDREGALRIGERIRIAVSRKPFELGTASVHLTISQGICSWNEPTPIPTDELIRVADRALYLVKDSGRDGVQALEYVPRG